MNFTETSERISILTLEWTSIKGGTWSIIKYINSLWCRDELLVLGCHGKFGFLSVKSRSKAIAKDHANLSSKEDKHPPE